MSHVLVKSHRLAIGAALVLLVASPLAALGGEPSTTNLKLMTDLTRQTVEDLVDRMGPGITGRGLTLRAYASGEEYEFLTNVITSILAERGIVTYQPQGPNSGAVAPEEALVFQFQALSYGVTYTKVSRSHLIGGRRVRRSADANILATVIDPATGEVSWIGEASHEHSDQFSYGDLARVEEGSFGFVHPALPGGGWGKYAEPVLVSGIVVGLIYLFFSNQSDN